MSTVDFQTSSIPCPCTGAAARTSAASLTGLLPQTSGFCGQVSVSSDNLCSMRISRDDLLEHTTFLFC